MSKKKLHSKKSDLSDNAPLTRGMISHMFEDMKDFTRSLVNGVVNSAVKNSEMALRKEMTEFRNEVKGDISKLDGRVSGIEVAVTEHSKMIKNLDVKIDNVRTELKEEIHGVEGILTQNMQQMEARLTEKIEGNKEVLEDHEERIMALEKVV